MPLNDQCLSFIYSIIVAPRESCMAYYTISRTSRKLQYVAEYGDGVLNDLTVYRQYLNLDLLLFRSRSQLDLP